MIFYNVIWQLWKLVAIYIKSYHLQIGLIWLPPLLFVCLYFFLLPKVPPKYSRTIFNKNGKSGYSFSFSTIQYNVDYRFVVYHLYYIGVCSFYTQFVQGFIMNGCCSLSNAFSTCVEMILGVLAFILFIWRITFTDLHMLNLSLQLWGIWKLIRVN